LDFAVVGPVGGILDRSVDFRVLEVWGEAEDADDFGGEDAGARFWEAGFDFEALAVAEGLLIGVSGVDWIGFDGI
jgi:hypothetical protein